MLDRPILAQTSKKLSIDGDDGGGVLGAGAGATDQDGVGKISVPPKIIMTVGIRAALVFFHVL